MQKELNPEIFGERKVSSSHPAGISPVSGVAPEIFNIDKQIFDLREHLRQIRAEYEGFRSQIIETSKSLSLKIDRLAQQILRLESSHNGLAQETANRLNALQSRLHERRSIDAKVQELVDRHTNILKTYEVRMNHLQKLLAEKEEQFVQAQAALNEAKMEIARLKRL
ncbi:MAG: hypothetical protein N2578_00090 [Bdellovibrionaceae bacterium]|nr:hypothetical protein [Pseudobdellovibrionaceae bacterium]